eukprot:4247715-Pleurochrysis_carterae.AAC.1
MFVSANLRGGVLNRARWTSNLKSFSELRADFISVQEHNLHRDSKGLDSIKFLANKYGFAFFFAPLPRGKRIGGAGILVRNETYARLHKTSFRSHYSGGACTLSFMMNDMKLKVASVYAPVDGKERPAFFKSVSSMIDSSTILSGDFNCVDDITLDTQRSSDTPYSNERNSGYCLSRIDRQYLPDLPNCQWTSAIADKIDNTYHAMIYSKLSLIDENEQPKGRDLFTINSQVIHIAEIRAVLIEEINKTLTKHKSNPDKIQKTFGYFKYNIRKILKKATLQHAKKANEDIADIDRLLALLHASQIKKPTPEGAASRTRLIEERMKIKKQMSAPKPHSSYFVHKRSELMSRQFWQSTFPKTSNTFKGILKLCKVENWMDPPPKNTDTGEYTSSTSEEAAKYYRHLYTKPPVTEQAQSARRKIILLPGRRERSRLFHFKRSWPIDINNRN